MKNSFIKNLNLWKLNKKNILKILINYMDHYWQSHILQELA